MLAINICFVGVSQYLETFFATAEWTFLVIAKKWRCL